MPLDARLTKLLTKKAVHADIHSWLEQIGVSNMDDLATLVETQAEIKADVVGQTSQRDNVQQVCRVKQAWRIARDEWDRRSERRRQGWTEDMMDDPLPPEERHEKYLLFERTYAFSLRSWDIGADSLLGRLTQGQT